MLGDRLRSDCGPLIPDMASTPLDWPRGDVFTDLGAKVSRRSDQTQEAVGCRAARRPGCGLRLDRLATDRNPGWGQLDTSAECYNLYV